MIAMMGIMGCVYVVAIVGTAASLAISGYSLYKQGEAQEKNEQLAKDQDTFNKNTIKVNGYQQTINAEHNQTKLNQEIGGAVLTDLMIAKFQNKKAQQVKLDAQQIEHNSKQSV